MNGGFGLVANVQALEVGPNRGFEAVVFGERQAAVEVDILQEVPADRLDYLDMGGALGLQAVVGKGAFAFNGDGNCVFVFGIG